MACWDKIAFSAFSSKILDFCFLPFQEPIVNYKAVPLYPMKRVIIIGASSGIGEELARKFSREGWTVGLAARREAKLQAMKKDLPHPAFVQAMDVSQLEDARIALGQLIEAMGGIEMIVLNSGIGDRKVDWKREQEILQVNAAGFMALANYAFEHFMKTGGGHIVGVSSILAVRGLRQSGVYSGSKAFISTYMDAMRHRSAKKKLGITVTDVRPGFIATPMTEGATGMFWVAQVDSAVTKMYRAIQNRRAIVYVPQRWWWIAQVLRFLPRFLRHQV